jgi:hypothetical protein
LLVEKFPEIGGTGVHSPVSLVCKFHGTDHRPINLGIHQELFPAIYAHSTRDFRPTAKRLTYDEKELFQTYKRLVAAEDNLEIHTGVAVESVTQNQDTLESVTLSDQSEVCAKVFIDATADGNLAAMAGCGFEMGRVQDGAMQSATLVFGVEGVDRSKLLMPDISTRGGLDSLWAELTPLFLAAKAAGKTDNPRKSVVAFAYPDGERLLFNSTASLGVDPTSEASVEEALRTAEKQIHELFGIIQEHPAFQSSRIDFIARKLGVREGRRIHGEYTLTKEDCLGEARFGDMVAACAYELDIHNPQGGDAFMQNIPGSGYYHIPYRCIVARDKTNLLLGSRCISGTHEAHSSYRVMSGVSAIGQAAGTAASLAVSHGGGSVREVPASWIRYVLRNQAQFVEGTIEEPTPRAL